MKFNPDAIAIAGDGRVILQDDELIALEADFARVDEIAGGANGGCTNPMCNGTTNGICQNNLCGTNLNSTCVNIGSTCLDGPIPPHQEY